MKYEFFVPARYLFKFEVDAINEEDAIEKARDIWETSEHDEIKKDLIDIDSNPYNITVKEN
jgi:hypothetical protein